ncbi:MAG: ATP-binding protein [Methylococcaceae bacterium]
MVSTGNYKPQTDQLADAFQQFNALSQHMAQAYQALQGQVVKLHDELQAARSERLQTLVEKETLAERLQRLLEAMPAGVIVLDADNSIVDCNASASRFLDQPLIGLLWPDVVSRSLKSVPDNPHEGQLAHGQRLSISSSEGLEEGGRIILLTDVTEMRTLQMLVDQQNNLSAMGEMVARMAHQVRTPLSTAILYASQLNNGGLLTEQRQKFSDKIVERLLHLEKQINDMLVFARRGEMEMIPLSISSLLDKITESLRDQLAATQINVTVVNQVNVDRVVGNEDLLRGAIMNLLNNAIEALEGNGSITISLDNPGNGCWRLSVEDNGPGIDENLQQRVFDPFFTTRSSGTGLGLAIVKSVIKAHGGSIEIDPAVETGTRFDLYFPNDSQPQNILPGGVFDRISQVEV